MATIVTRTLSDRLAVSEGDLRAKPDGSSTVCNSVLRLIKNHLSGESKKPLVVHLSDHIGRCPALQEALRGVSFAFEDGVPYIRAMPGDLHITCTTWFTKTHIQRVLPMLTSRELDEDFLNLDTREVRLSGLLAANNFTGGSKQGRKMLDGAIVFEQDGKHSQEQVVLETGFSQDLEGLRKDKDDWLYRSSTVMLVFLINIDEDCSALRRHQKSEDFQARLHDMMTRFVCQGGISSGDDSDDYDAHAIRMVNEVFEGIAQDVLVEDWLGPLTVHLEAWERAKDGCRRRGGPVVSSIRFA